MLATSLAHRRGGQAPSQVLADSAPLPVGCQARLSTRHSGNPCDPRRGACLDDSERHNRRHLLAVPTTELFGGAPVREVCGPARLRICALHTIAWPCFLSQPVHI